MKEFIIKCQEDEDCDEKAGVATAQKVVPPSMYKVLMHNDDYTTMEFVILCLKKFFNKTDDEAHSVMLKIHTSGVGMCGIYTHEVAESKSQKVMNYARREGHPLKLSFEPCDS